MKWRYQCLLTVLFLGTFASAIRSQETPAADANAAPPPGVDKFYYDLSQSKDPKDRVIKSMAERYLGLVKIQEWSDLSGKFRTVAHYVRHDPNLTTVTIESVKGRGADRTTKEITVPVEKLSKTCQSRVKQIDTMQEKLQEMAKGKPGENGAAPAPAASPEAPGGPLPDARGPEGGPPTAAAPPAVETAPDPSASDPDPLGFAEIAPTPAATASPGPESPPPVGPADLRR